MLGPQSWWAGTQSGSLYLPCTAASPPFAVFPARSTRCMQKKKSTESICGKLWRSDLSCWSSACLLQALQQRALLPGSCGGSQQWQHV